MVTYDFRTFPTSHVPVTECDPHPDRAARLVVSVDDLVLAGVQVEKVAGHQMQGVLAVERELEFLVVDDDLIAGLEFTRKLDHIDVHPPSNKTDLKISFHVKLPCPLPDTGRF